MNDGVLINYPLNRWAKENEDLIHKYYSKIRYIIEEPHLSGESSDVDLASFCKTEGCVMLASDKKAYESWLEKCRTDEICISMFSKNVKAKQIVYHVRIS